MTDLISELIEVEWLLDEPRIRVIVYVGDNLLLMVAAYQDDGHRASQVSHASIDVRSRHPWHGAIEYQQIELVPFVLKNLEHLLAVFRRDQIVIPLFQDRQHQAAYPGVIFGKKDFAGHPALGNSAVHRLRLLRLPIGNHRKVNRKSRTFTGRRFDVNKAAVLPDNA